MPPVTIRKHIRKFPPIHAWHQLPVVPWCQMGHYLPKRPVFALDPYWHAGAYYVQEASSMFLDWVLPFLFQQTDGLRVLDLCASPGGKSTLLASWLDGNGLLVSNEVIRSRVAPLIENMTRWGYDNVVITRKDPSAFRELDILFDIVVVDAPCSGEGLFRKDTDFISEWTPELGHHCALRQQRILSDAFHTVKEGGYLIYSTCTYNPQENEQHHRQICDNGFEPVLIPLKQEWAIVHNQGYHFYPHLIEGEGFFLTVYKKTKATSECSNRKLKKTFFKPIAASVIEPYAVLPESRVVIQSQKEVFCIFPKAFLPDLEQLYVSFNDALPIVEAGIMKGGNLIPSHALALSFFLSDRLPSVSLSLEESLQYLSRENMIFPSSLPLGIVRVMYNNLTLGWAKHLGNRVNNYYPQSSRLRMKWK